MEAAGHEEEGTFKNQTQYNKIPFYACLISSTPKLQF
jgi:hypothetical protein